MKIRKQWRDGKMVLFEIDGVPQLLSGTAAPVTKFEPLPWPRVLEPLRHLARAGDRGAGDIIARVIGPIGGDAFKRWYKFMFGHDCGCAGRQEVLNRRWPL